MLNPSQLEDLTGYVQPAAQIRALVKMGISHRVRPDGKPIVVWSALEREGLAQVEPDFGAISR